MTPFGVRQFRKLLAGCVAINVVTFVLITAGNVLAGNFLGETALAGVALASPFLTFGTFVVSLVGAGTAINYSVRRGAVDRDGAVSAFMHGVWITLSAALGVGLSVWLLRDAYIALMTSDPEVVRHAAGYWRWLPFSVAFMCVNGLLLNCCYCDGDTSYATGVCCGQCALTLAVSFAALHCGCGAAACSLGYAVGYAFSCAMLAMHFLRRSNTFAFRWCFAWREIPVILRASSGDSLGFLGMAMTYVLLGYVLSHSFGPVAMLGLPVYIVMCEFMSYADGFSAAMQPIVAVYHGEGNERSLRRVARHIFGLLAVVSVAVAAVLILFPGLVLRLVGIDDPECVPHARAVVGIVALRIVPAALLGIMNNYYQLLERVRLAVGFTVFYYILLPVAMMLVFPAFGERGFWYWTVASTWGGAALFSAFLVWRYGRGRFPFMLDRGREAAISTFDLELREMQIAVTAEGVSKKLMESGVEKGRALRARLLVEETLMVIKERNAGATVYAEVSLDLNDGIRLTLRDDGIIFDITDADARVSGLRVYLVATMMRHQHEKSNILTTGFNRNVFRL